MIGAPDFAVLHEGQELDHAEQMDLDVIAHDAVRLDDGAGFAVDVIPRTSDLRTQPAFQRAEMFAETFAVVVRTPDAFKSGQQFVGQTGAAELFAAITAVPRFFAEDFVHV